MSDLLSAASLLAGVSGVLYSVWYPEMRAALQLDVPAYGRDVGKDQVKSATLERAVPIVFLVAALAACLAPPAWEVLSSAVSTVGDGDATYDAVKAAFLVVYVALAVLLATASRDLFRLVALWRRFIQPVEAA